MQIRETPVEMFPDGRMTPANAAAYLGLTMKTLAMKRCYGTGPKFVKRGRVFYYRDDLDAWLIATRTASTGRLSRRLRMSKGSGK